MSNRIDGSDGSSGEEVGRSAQKSDAAQTLSLVYQFTAVAFGVPALAIALIVGYFLLTGQTLKNSEWKLVTLLVWLGALLALGILFFRVMALRPKRRTPKLQSVPIYTSQTKAEPQPPKRAKANSQVNSWERRKTERLGVSLFFAAVVVPVMSLTICYSYFSLFSVVVRYKDWKTVVAIVWIGTMAVLARAAWRATKDKILYSK